MGSDPAAAVMLAEKAADLIRDNSKAGFNMA